MSNASMSNASMSTSHPVPFLERLVLALLPYFLPTAPDLATARAEIIETLTAYGPRTRSEMLNAVQVIAFSFAALDTLADAKAPDMSPSMRVRYQGCANSLSRTSQQNEKTLAYRLAGDVPARAEPKAEPINDVPDVKVQETLEQARSDIATFRERLTGARPAALAPANSKQNENNRLWGTAMMNILAEMGMPVQPAAPAP